MDLKKKTKHEQNKIKCDAPVPKHYRQLIA